MKVRSLLRATNGATEDPVEHNPKQDLHSIEAPPSSAWPFRPVCKCVVSADRACAKTCAKRCTQTCPVVCNFFRNVGCNSRRIPNRRNAQPFLGVCAPPLRYYQPRQSASAGCRPRPPNHSENQGGRGRHPDVKFPQSGGGGAEVQQQLDSMND